jgi:type II secretory pathway pseudopilin PulG
MRAFTLLETLASLAVILLIAGISFPVMSAAKRAGQRRQSVSDMKQIAASALLYREDWRSVDYGSMAAMGLPQFYPTLFGADPKGNTGYPVPPIRTAEYPIYYWMPVPEGVDGRPLSWARASERFGDRTVLVCDPWIAGFEAGLPIALKPHYPNRIDGVDLGGQLVKKKAYGEWIDFNRWELTDEQP